MEELEELEELKELEPELDGEDFKGLVQLAVSCELLELPVCDPVSMLVLAGECTSEVLLAARAPGGEEVLRPPTVSASSAARRSCVVARG